MNNGKKFVRYLGILIALDDSFPQVKTGLYISKVDAREGLLELIDKDETLRVAAVGNPTQEREDEQAASIQYIIARTPDLKAVEAGYIIPSDYHKKGIRFRKAFG